MECCCVGQLRLQFIHDLTIVLLRCTPCLPPPILSWFQSNQRSILSHESLALSKQRLDDRAGSNSMASASGDVGNHGGWCTGLVCRLWIPMYYHLVFDVSMTSGHNFCATSKSSKIKKSRFAQTYANGCKGYGKHMASPHIGSCLGCKSILGHVTWF